MTYIHPELNAYDTISRDIETNFHTHIGKTKDDIKTIVIVGGFTCTEAGNFLKVYPNATIHIFEPIVEYLNYAAYHFGGSGRCKFYNVAIGNVSGEIDFYRTSSVGSDSMFPVVAENKSGYSFTSNPPIKVQCERLSNIIQDDIDLLQVDVQGAELEVLKGTNLNNVKCLFLEIQKFENKHQIVYEGQCFMDDREKYLGESFVLHSIGLDNDLKNGTGNAFWIKSLIS